MLTGIPTLLRLRDEYRQRVSGEIKTFEENGERGVDSAIVFLRGLSPIQKLLADMRITDNSPKYEAAIIVAAKARMGYYKN